MKYLAVLLLSVGTLHAQSRILVGATGGQSFNNLSLGPSVAAEVPFGHRWELDPAFSIAPECKSGYGCGYGTDAKIGGIGWLNNRVGVSTTVERSSYWLSSVSKSAWYFSAGPVIRLRAWDTPMRLSFGYARQIANGISNGVETNHLEGGLFSIDARMGCAGPICGRAKLEIQVGRGLNQGNPVCDGTLGNGSQVGFAPCPRSSAISGGAMVTVSMEWPRRRGSEGDLF